MLRHHLKIALRNLLKRKGYTILNVTGLAIGMACCLIITLYVLDELSYDRFHEKIDRIYRVTTHAVIGENEWNTAIVSPALAPVLPDEIPEIEAAVRVDQFDNVVVKKEDRVYSEDRVLAADGNFFEVFSFPLSVGAATTALREPASVVLTRDKAEKYFGKGVDPVGETLIIDDQPYQVRGVLEPVPANSHIHFDIAFSFSSLRKGRAPRWENTNTVTYVLLKEGRSAELLPSKLQSVLKKHHPGYNEMLTAGFSWNLGMQPLTDIHLYSHLEDELEPNGDIQNVYLFSLVAFFILIIACINFVNLATARSADRAKEVGVRKTLGSDRRNLIGQFLMEAGLVSFSAMVLALGLTQLLRLPFNRVAGKDLSIHLFENPLMLSGVLGIAVLVTLLAGGYPAFYLSRFQPVEVLRGAMKAGSKNSVFRNVLVTFQFVLSISLIAGTVLIYQQLRFMQTKDLGLNKENVLIIKNADKLGEQQESFIEEAKRYSGVQSVSFSNLSPFDEYEGSYFVQKGKAENERRLLNFLRVSPEYLPTLDIELTDGRNFSREIAGDTAGIIINETAARFLGLQDPVDKVVEWGEPLRVIGVVKDYHFRSLHEEILPLALLPAARGNVLEARLQGNDLMGTINGLQEKWKRYTGNSVPFEYTFLDADFDALFRAELRLGRLVGAFAILAIFIACLGLLGLAAFMAERRAKEMGIRKIMGASEYHVLMLLSRDFTRLVGGAFLIAAPLIFWGVNRWLNSFAYRIEVGWESIVLAGLLALLIAWLTVSVQSLRVAHANPVEALRDE